MESRDFVHLHVHTEYSLLDGALRLESLFRKAIEFKMPALAITDHGNLFGAIKFYKLARQYGIRPIIGCEVYVAPGSRTEKSSTHGISDAAYHLTLLARDLTGYRNLTKLVSRAYLEGFYYKPRIDKELLSQHADGLIALSGCLKGEINQLLLQGQQERAWEVAGCYRDILGPENFYLEIQDQGLEEQRRIQANLVELSRRLAIPLVATNDCHYLEPTDARAHEVLLGIQTGKTLQDAHRMRFSSDQFYFRSPAEMAAVFQELPQAVSLTREIGERCELEIKFNETHLPQYQVPAGHSLESYLENLATRGLEERLVVPASCRYDRLEACATQPSLPPTPTGGGTGGEDYWERLRYELRVIQEMGYAGYFLIVWDFIDYARRQGIPVGPGRGSAAGSLVAYALRITDLDPIKYNLVFERFLNPERVTLPDIDIDFCMERRDEVIDYVIRKYGEQNVSQIITFGTMMAKAVIRDVGRCLDMSYGEVDKIAKLVPTRLNISLKDAIQEEPRLRELLEKDEQVRFLLETAQVLEGLPRHASTHAAGVVIAPRPLTEYLPLFKSSKGEVTTQYVMDDIEALGLLKMDFLGLRTLTVIQHTLELIREADGKELDLAGLPLDDPAAYDLLGEARTVGVFQLESRGMREILKKLKPRCFEDVVALLALYRPGPLGSGMVEDFIQRKQGKVAIQYEVPQLEGILKDTCGIILYQEQVMQIASVLAGFSLGAADMLRRAMGKKKADVMAQQREQFVQGAVAREIPQDKAAKIFDQMEYFAGYGFNRSHSAAYGLIAYQTAYLKAHFPREFLASLLTYEADNTDKVLLYLRDCKDMGIKVLPPDVNQGGRDFTISGQAVRFGLAAVKNVGQGAIEAIIAARDRQGPFESLENLCQRVDLKAINRRVLESLIKAGACDFQGKSRAQMVASLDAYLEAGQREQRDLASGQISLFGKAPRRRTSAEPKRDATKRVPPLEMEGHVSSEMEGHVSSWPKRDLPEWDRKELLAYEKEALGFYLSGHPLDPYQRELQLYTNANTQTFALATNGKEVRLAGTASKVKVQITKKKGEQMALVTLEDLYGSLEVVVYPNLFKETVAYLEGDEPIFVQGKPKTGDDKTNLIAEKIFPLANLKKLKYTKVHLRLSSWETDRENLVRLRDIAAVHSGDCSLYLHFFFPDERQVSLEAGESWRVNPDGSFLSQVEEVLGTEAIYLE